jgi:hypothetical protein
MNVSIVEIKKYWRMTRLAMCVAKNLRRLEVSKTKKGAQHGVHADGWIRTVKLAFFVTLGLFRFVGESRPASRR